MRSVHSADYFLRSIIQYLLIIMATFEDVKPQTKEIGLEGKKKTKFLTRVWKMVREVEEQKLAAEAEERKLKPAAEAEERKLAAKAQEWKIK